MFSSLRLLIHYTKLVQVFRTIELKILLIFLCQKTVSIFFNFDGSLYQISWFISSPSILYSTGYFMHYLSLGWWKQNEHHNRVLKLYALFNQNRFLIVVPLQPSNYLNMNETGVQKDSSRFDGTNLWRVFFFLLLLRCLMNHFSSHMCPFKISCHSCPVMF